MLFLFKKHSISIKIIKSRMFEKKTSLGAVGGIETKTNGLGAFPPQQPLSTTQELSIFRERKL